MNKKTFLSFFVFGLVLSIALFLRVFVAFHLKIDEGVAPLYESYAVNLLRYHIYSDWDTVDPGQLPPPTTLRVPVYPVFLTAVYAIFGEKNQLAVNILQAIIDTGTCLLVGAIAAQLSPKHAKKKIFYIAVLIAAFNPFLIAYVSATAPEIVTTFLLTLAVYLWLRLRYHKQHIFYWFLIGVSLGLATLTRPESCLVGIAFFFFIVAQFLLKQKSIFYCLKNIMSMGVGVVLFIIPWTVRNYGVLHTFQPLAPFNAIGPDEFDPKGFKAWCRTWVWQDRDVEFYVNQVDGVDLTTDQLPRNAYSDETEKQKLGVIFREYVAFNTLVNESNAPSPDSTQSADTTNDNQDTEATDSAQTATDSSSLSSDNPQPSAQLLAADHFLADLAHQRSSAQPVQYYFVLPILRSFSMWFTPHLEFVSDNLPWLTPSSMLTYYPMNFVVLAYLLVILNGVLIIFSLIGLYRLVRVSQWRLEIFVLLFLFISRTLFFAYFAFPEQRYMLELYPLLFVVASFGMLAVETKNTLHKEK